MGYYQAQLNELIQYPDMRTEVFQIFREVGNAIVFCMLIEQALVSMMKKVHFIHKIVTSLLKALSRENLFLRNNIRAFIIHRPNLMSIYILNQKESEHFLDKKLPDLT